MHKLQKVALVGAVLGSVGSFGVSPALAHDHGRGGERGNDFDVTQSIECRSHDMNIDILGSVGAINGALGNALNGEGNPGAQPTDLGSDMGCNSEAF
ncbi:hypothetical protein AB0L99_12890 [Streptomyces sp. NPDC051954]|jgi:hypothetical protein|uniref:hypothetical protein n=1 Tax=unclassified Streptomyces TaxID=2593676 RepID=UPI00341CA955